MTGFAPHDRVLVSPRHLAGTGLDHLSDVIGPLIHLFGWNPAYDTTGEHVALDSPDHSTALDFEPTRRDGRWWTITHHEPYWKAEFTRQTPIEAVAAVTQCLPQLLGDHRHADRIPLTTATLADTAELNRWTASAGNGTFTSPDGHCTLTRDHNPDAEPAVTVTHSVNDGFDTHWTGVFTPDVPERLIAQFFVHLSTTAPVEREFREIPFLAHDLGDALITPVHGGGGLNPHVHHAAAQAGRALTRRHR